MAASDQTYFNRRAEAELESARRASHPEAVKAHHTLAGHYLSRAFGCAPAELVATSYPEETSYGE